MARMVIDPRLDSIISTDDFQARAKATLPLPLYEYFASGTDDELTLCENRASFKRVLLLPRCMRPVDRLDTRLNLFGQTFLLPVFVSPAGVHKLADAEGEGASARACARAGVACGVSQHATTSIEDVAAALGAGAANGGASKLWYQCYILKDRSITADLVRRAVAAGYGAIVVTVDSVVLGSREADSRNGFMGLPSGLSLVNYAPLNHSEDRTESAWDQNTEKMFAKDLGWHDVTWLKSLSALPLIVKGILRAGDAIAALDAGADGIIVSNHGGRQLDGCPGAMDALPAIAAAVTRYRAAHGFSANLSSSSSPPPPPSSPPPSSPSLSSSSCLKTGEGRVCGSVPPSVKWPILIDGGVRRGTDVVKALACGASAVLLGKPVFFALAVAGEAGVSHLLEGMRKEVKACMALCGANDLSEITPDLVTRPSYAPGQPFFRAAL